MCSVNIYFISEMLDISLGPINCLCPNTSLSYTCKVNGAIEIQWRTNTTTTDDFLRYTAHSEDSHRETDDFQITFVRESAMNSFYNFTSILEVINQDLIGTDLQCIGYDLTRSVSDTVPICVKGTVSQV